MELLSPSPADLLQPPSQDNPSSPDASNASAPPVTTSTNGAGTASDFLPPSSPSPDLTPADYPAPDAVSSTPSVPPQSPQRTELPDRPDVSELAREDSPEAERMEIAQGAEIEVDLGEIEEEEVELEVDMIDIPVVDTIQEDVSRNPVTVVAAASPLKRPRADDVDTDLTGNFIRSLLS